MASITVRLPDIEHAAITAAAVERGITKSELVRQILAAEADYQATKMRVCPECGSMSCDHPAPPRLGLLLREGPAVPWSRPVDLRAYTQRIFDLGARLGRGRL